MERSDLPVLYGAPVEARDVDLARRPAPRWSEATRALGRRVSERIETLFRPEYRTGVRDGTGHERFGSWAVFVLGQSPQATTRRTASGLWVAGRTPMWNQFWLAVHPHEGYPFDLEDDKDGDISTALYYLCERSAWRWRELVAINEQFREESVVREQARLDRDHQVFTDRHRDTIRAGLLAARDLNGTIQDDSAVRDIERRAELGEELRRQQAAALAQPSDARLRALDDLRARVMPELTAPGPATNG